MSGQESQTNPIRHLSRRQPVDKYRHRIGNDFLRRTTLPVRTLPQRCAKRAVEDQPDKASGGNLIIPPFYLSDNSQSIKLPGQKLDIRTAHRSKYFPRLGVIPQGGIQQQSMDVPISPQGLHHVAG
jgi:hypothetical protein